MNHKILLILATIPVLTGSLLLFMVSLVDAAEPSPQPATCTPATVGLDRSALDLDTRTVSAQTATTNETTVASAEGAIDDDIMDFTAAESDAAVALFGCDCPPCINALRQLRSQSLSRSLNQALQVNNLQANSQGHCWSSMQRRHSPQEIEQQLQQLPSPELPQVTS
jgi:hypothetical protein